MATQQISSSPSQVKIEVKSLAQEMSDIAERATNFTKASGAAVFLVNGEHLVVASATGAVIAPGHCIPVAGSFAGRAVQSGRVVRCDDAEADTTVDVKAFLPLRVRSLIAVPIGGVGRAVSGALVVVSDTINAFSRTHMAILQTMADVVAEKCKTEDPFTAVLRAEVEPRRSPRLEASSQSSAYNVTPSVLVPAGPGGAVEREFVPVSAAPEFPTKPLAVPKLPKIQPLQPMQPIQSMQAVPAIQPLQPIQPMQPVQPIAAVPPRNPVTVVRVPSAYDRPRPAVSRPSSGRMPIMSIAVVVAVFAAAAFGWSRYHHSETAAPTTVAANAAPDPAPQFAAPVPVQPPPVVTPRTEPVPARASEPEHVPAKHTLVLEAVPASQRGSVERAAVEEEPQPVPHLGRPSAAAPAHADALVSVPLALTARNNAPELLAPTAAIPMAPVSKLVPARLISRVSPEFPPLLRKLGKEGSVSLRMHINAKGVVDNVEMIGGDSMFAPAATSAVKQWRYEPANLDGKPTESHADVVLRFSLPRR